MGYVKIGKWYGDGDAPVLQWKENLDPGYQDISAVEYYYSLGPQCEKDYLFQRTCSMAYMTGSSQTFSDLDDMSKRYAAQNFIVSKEDRDTLYTDTEQEEYWSIYIAKAQEARQTRWNNVKSYISYRLTKDQSNEIANDTIVLNEKYIYYGIESKALDNIDGLFDYVEGTAAYTDAGFPSKPYYTTELGNGVMNFLNGTYNID